MKFLNLLPISEEACEAAEVLEFTRDVQHFVIDDDLARTLPYCDALTAALLTLACAVFVAAEFSLTAVERGELERAAAAGEPGAPAALRAARSLTFQLSGAQLGITVTSLVIGMLAEPSLAALLRGPLRAAGLPAGAREALASMFAAYDEGGLVGDPGPLASLLGRPPTSWPDAVRAAAGPT